MSNPDRTATDAEERALRREWGDLSLTTERFQREIEPTLPPTYRDWLHDLYRQQGAGYKTFRSDMRRATKDKRRVRKFWKQSLPTLYVGEVSAINRGRGVGFLEHYLVFAHYYTAAN